jgi:glyoxylate/hydroxypyruvate reductase A
MRQAVCNMLCKMAQQALKEPMMQLALITREGSLDFLDMRLREALPGAKIASWPDPACLAAEVAICWDPPHGLLATMPKLRLIHSIAAGTDKLMADPSLPALPVCRICDEDVAMAMGEYCHWGVLWFQRGFDRITENARQAKWHRFAQRAASDTPVAILGLGAIGTHVARRLARAGYPIRGWSRRPRKLAGVRCMHGAEGLARALRDAAVVICLLPLTPDTRGILNADNLAHLAPGAGLINCGRGAHMVLKDLLVLLANGHMAGMILDTFEHEPLTADNRLWGTPGVLITPHMAALAKPTRIAGQIAENIRRLNAQQSLLNLVDRAIGY